MIGDRFKLIYNALWQLPYQPVDFGRDPFWKEIQEQHRQGELGAKFSRLYFPPTRAMFELYDLRADPFEINNLAEDSEYATVQHELKAELQERMILNRDYLPLPIPPGPRR